MRNRPAGLMNILWFYCHIPATCTLRQRTESESIYLVSTIVTFSCILFIFTTTIQNGTQKDFFSNSVALLVDMTVERTINRHGVLSCIWLFHNNASTWFTSLFETLWNCGNMATCLQYFTMQHSLESVVLLQLFNLDNCSGFYMQKCYKNNEWMSRMPVCLCTVLYYQWFSV